MARDAELTTELVLSCAELVPPGHVVSYGDIAELANTSPRRVGTIMASRGGEVAWWRVTNRNGELPAHLLPLARKHWQREGIGHTDQRCQFVHHQMDLEALATLFTPVFDEIVREASGS